MEHLSNLSTGDKIIALLAVADEPLSQSQIIEWLQIPKDEVNTPGFISFLAPYIVQTKTERGDLFWIPKNQQVAVLAQINVNVSSVRRRIIDAAMDKVRARKE